MSIRDLNKQSSAALDRVITSSVQEQAKHDASDSTPPARQDAVYLAAYYARRLDKIWNR